MFLIEAMLLLFLVEQTRIGNIDVGQVILILQSNVLFVSSVSNMIDLAKKQFEDLMDLCEEKGVIIVSHRVGVVHLADRVVFMKSGKIVCEGKHNDLMQKNQSYREFYKSQAKWYV